MMVRHFPNTVSDQQTPEHPAPGPDPHGPCSLLRVALSGKPQASQDGADPRQGGQSLPTPVRARVCTSRTPVHRKVCRRAESLPLVQRDRLQLVSRLRSLSPSGTGTRCHPVCGGSSASRARPWGEKQPDAGGQAGGGRSPDSACASGERARPRTARARSGPRGPRAPDAPSSSELPREVRLGRGSPCRWRLATASLPLENDPDLEPGAFSLQKRV